LYGGFGGVGTGALPVDAAPKGADKVSQPDTFVPTCLARAANALPLQNELHGACSLGRSLLSVQTINHCAANQALVETLRPWIG
jgi:hypothetical protein